MCLDFDGVEMLVKHVAPFAFGISPAQRGQPARPTPGIPRSLRFARSRPLTLREGGVKSLLKEGGDQGCQFDSWLAKAKVWGWPPVWMKIMGVLGSMLRFWIWSMSPAIDLAV